MHVLTEVICTKQGTYILTKQVVCTVCISIYKLTSTHENVHKWSLHTVSYLCIIRIYAYVHIILVYIMHIHNSNQIFQFPGTVKNTANCVSHVY